MYTTSASTFVLQIDQRAGADIFRQQKGATVGAMGWDRAVFGRMFEESVNP
jgi:hypothetical protein